MSISTSQIRPDQSYIRKQPLVFKQVKPDKQQVRKETVKNFTVAVLCGIALILIIKVWADFGK